jgi:hypothetical protein
MGSVRSDDSKNGEDTMTKSYTSALVGIALDQGCLASVDQKMMEFFPEFTDQITYPRKEQIAIRGEVDCFDLPGNKKNDHKNPVK